MRIFPASGPIYLPDVTNDHIIGVETPFGKHRVGRVHFEEGERYGLIDGLDIQRVVGRPYKSGCLERLTISPVWDFEKEVNIYFFDSERELVKWLFDIEEAYVEEEPIAHFESGEVSPDVLDIEEPHEWSLSDTDMSRGKLLKRLEKRTKKSEAFYRLHEAEITPGTVAYVMKKALTEKQYKRFLKEIKREQIVPDFINFMEDERGITAGALLNVAFVWKESKHGYNYWSDLCKRLM